MPLLFFRRAARRALGALALGALLCGPMAPGVAAPPGIVQVTVAGQPLPFPVPAGYVDAASLSADLQRMGDAMTGPANRLLAFWVDPAEVREMNAGKAEGLQRYFMLQVHRRREGLTLTPADFKAVRDATIGDQAAFTQQLRQQVDKVAAQVSQQVQRSSGDPSAQLKVGDLQAVGVLFDEPQAFGTLLRSVIDVGDGKPAPMLMGLVMVRHHNRLIALGAYAREDRPGAQAWVRQATRAWAQRVNALP